MNRYDEIALDYHDRRDRRMPKRRPQAVTILKVVRGDNIDMAKHLTNIKPIRTRELHNLVDACYKYHNIRLFIVMLQSLVLKGCDLQNLMYYIMLNLACRSSINYQQCYVMRKILQMGYVLKRHQVIDVLAGEDHVGKINALLKAYRCDLVTLLIRLKLSKSEIKYMIRNARVDVIRALLRCGAYRHTTVKVALRTDISFGVNDAIIEEVPRDVKYIVYAVWHNQWITARYLHDMWYVVPHHLRNK